MAEETGDVYLQKMGILPPESSFLGPLTLCKTKGCPKKPLTTAFGIDFWMKPTPQFLAHHIPAAGPNVVSDSERCVLTTKEREIEFVYKYKDDNNKTKEVKCTLNVLSLVYDAEKDGPWMLRGGSSSQLLYRPNDETCGIVSDKDLPRPQRQPEPKPEKNAATAASGGSSSSSTSSSTASSASSSSASAASASASGSGVLPQTKPKATKLAPSWAMPLMK